MITNFKLFESLNESEPEVGDYVLCDEGEAWNGYYTGIYGHIYLDFLKYVKNNIGIIDRIVKSEFYTAKYFQVRYDNLPEIYETICDGKIRKMELNDIKYWAKNIEDLTEKNIEIYNSTLKYNL